MIKNAMQYAEFVALKSVDFKIKVGCAIFDSATAENISAGFNGLPDPLPQQRESQESGKSGFLHAELRAALSCKVKKSVKKEVYITLPPCTNCAKILLELGGIHKVYYKPHPDYSIEGLLLLKNSGVEIFEYEETL